MLSPLESLPPELFHNICDLIDKDENSWLILDRRLYNLSLTSKKCRSYTIGIIFRNLTLKARNSATLTEELACCIETLSRLGVLHLVHTVSIVISAASPATERTAEHKRAVESLEAFPSMESLDIFSHGGFANSFTHKVEKMLAKRYNKLTIGGTGKYRWWHESSK
jgi:hypothetical protein